MEEQPDAKHAHMHNANNQVIDKIPNGQSLNETTGTCVPENSLAGGHGAALFIKEHDPQGGHTDDNALNKRDNMNIPVQLCPRCELVIRTSKEDWRKQRRENSVDEQVEDKCSYHLMDMVDKCRAVDLEEVRLYKAPQPFWRWRKGVQHCRSPLS